MAAKDRLVAGPLPTAFLKKTYELVNDHCVDKIISWNADGSTFIIWCPGDLARDLLPQKFKHNKFSSFNRQLNTYGFKKISPDRWEFAHEFFLRGQEGLLGRINRPKSSPAAASANSGKYPIPSSDSNCGLTVLMEENEQLKSEKARLTSENKKLKSVCDSIRHLVSNHSFRGSGSGGKLEEEEAPAITEAEGSRNMDAQLEATLGSEESEFFPGEEELSLRLSLPHLPNKRAWNGPFRPPTSQN